MIVLIKLFLAIFILFGAGFILARLVLGKLSQSFFFLTPLFFLLGSGIVSWQLLVYSLMRFSWSVWRVVVPWIFFALALLLKEPSGFWPKKLRGKIRVNLSPFEWIVFGVLIFQLIVLVFRFSLYPQQLGWDGVAIWFYKAKVFFIEGKVHLSFLTNNSLKLDQKGVSEAYFHPDYPLLVPLVTSWVFLMVGKVNIFYGKTLWLLFFGSLVVLFAWVVKNLINQKVSLFFTFLLLTPAVLFDHLGRKYAGYADLPLAAYFMGAVSFWMMWLKTKERKFAVIAFILASFAALTKNEGVAFLVGMTLLSFFLAIGHRKKLPALAMTTPFVLLSPWFWFKFQHGITSYLFINGVNFHLERAVRVLTGFLKEMLNVAHFNILWLVVIFSVLVFYLYRWHDRLTRPLLALILWQIASYFFIFLITPLEVEKHLASSLDRLLFQIMPLALLLVAIIFSNLWGRMYTNDLG